MTDTGGTLTGGGVIDGSTEDSGLEAELLDSLSEAETEDVGLAGGGGCAMAPGLTWTFLLVWLLRGLLALPLAASAADFQELQTLEGGRFVSVRSADPGPKWSGRVAMHTQHAVTPLTILRSSGMRRPLVLGLTTVEIAGAINVADLVSVGVALPWHHVAHVSQPTSLTGDVTVWGLLPMGRSPLALRLSHERPTTREGGKNSWQRKYWSARATTPTVVGEHGIGRTTVGWHTSVRFQRSEEIRGVTVRNRIEGALGVERPILDGNGGVSAELFGAMPLHIPKSARELPMELLTSARGRLFGQVEVRASAGFGLTKAPGTPGARMMVGLTAQGHDPRDTDQDGIRNLLDHCKTDPEDHDGFQDKDGCPDPDNDEDGLLDEADACPDLAEVFNLYLDDDGCPDALARWVIHVVGPEVYDVSYEGESYKRLAGETFTAKRQPGEALLLVEAEGFHPKGVRANLLEGETHSQVDLEPIVTGQLLVQVVDAEGSLVPGASLQIEGEEVDLEDGWYGGAQDVGRVSIEAAAPGWEAVHTDAVVEFDAVRTVVVELVPTEVFLDGRQINLGDSPMFALDSTRLANTDWLDALARWLSEHPEVLKVRVEGHADSIGTSAYNFDLSEKRAAIVLDALVTRGVARERLLPVGSGEALAWSGARRMVSFTVLVHAEW